MSTHSPVLIADDDQDDVVILRLAFQRAGLPNPLIVVRDGQQLVDHLSKLENSEAKNFPRLLLLDLKMPKLNGFDVLVWMAARDQLKELPVIVLSASSHEKDMEKARTLGARDYYVKPRTLGDLVQFVQEISVKWLKGI